MFNIYSFYFFMYSTTTTDIYTLSLHDALPISIVATFRVAARAFLRSGLALQTAFGATRGAALGLGHRKRFAGPEDRKSTRLNSSHSQISYAVFCLKKKKIKNDKY